MSEGRWCATSDGWINTYPLEGDDDTSVSVVEYEGCGSHAARWRSNRDYRLAILAPVMLEYLQRVAFGIDNPITHEELLELFEAVETEAPFVLP